jgi:tetratricopeptide (TPR) repeat protein
LVLLLAGLVVSPLGCGGALTQPDKENAAAGKADHKEKWVGGSKDTKKAGGGAPDRASGPLTIGMADGRSPAEKPGEGLAATAGGGRSPLGGKANGTPEKKPDQPPQVWHRDPKRPTFARVYVGDHTSLELVSLHVTVTVEGPRARTLVDHVFRNPHDRQLEGTFEYPLPTGASPSYFAMFLGQSRDAVPPRWAGRGGAPALPQDALAKLTPQQVVKQISTADWGRLQEGHVVAKEKALETYEEVVRGKVDPALLEYAGGNTFSGRVFPIPPKGYNRVLIAYEELLPVAREQCVYRYALPDCKLTELRFTLNASGPDCKEAVFQPKEATKAEGGDVLSFTKTWADKGPGGEAVFAFRPPQPQVQAISGRQGESGPLYLYARIRPDLDVAKAAPFSENAVFLLDTSLSEAGRFAVNMMLLRKILETDPDIKRFNVLTFNVGAAWVEPGGWLDNTAANRDKVFERLEGLLLEGATDLSAALDKLTRTDFATKDRAPLNVFLLSDGQITWGEPEAAALAARFEARCPAPTRFHCYRTGIGAENQELFEALTRKGGGIFTCYGEAEVAACAAAHRSQCLQVQSVRLSGGSAAEDVLIAGRKASVYPGGELVVAARMRQPGQTTILVEGTFLGRKFAQEYAVEMHPVGELAPRGWGEIAVASLLALNDPALDNVITAYCQEFGIGSRLASFLVLENETDYKRLNLEQERGQAVHGDLGTFLDTAWAGLARTLRPKESFERFLRQVEGRLGLAGDAQVKKLLTLLGEDDFEVSAKELPGSLLARADVPPSYLTARESDDRDDDVTPFLAESRRRTGLKDTAGAVRALSSVVEVNPGRADALRLVGYRLLDLGEPGQAARLFAQVQRSRPFEPHSYRDLARALESNGQYALAALNYEIVLAGTWHSRFRDSLKQVAREEYAEMMQQALRQRPASPELAAYFGGRLEKMGPPARGDLRVTISWNSDATDVDLWVIEPSGEKCYYQNRQTRGGGQLTEDLTQGYGPERYLAKKAQHGEYRVVVHYFRANPNLLGGETHVNVVVTRHAGTPQETTERHTVILKKKDEQAEVCRVKF